jgi:hypothetical protein
MTEAAFKPPPCCFLTIQFLHDLVIYFLCHFRIPVEVEISRVSVSCSWHSSALLYGTSISLGIGDIDWEIDRAIQQCGGVPRTGYRYTAYFHFNRNTEMAKEIYDKIVKELYG